VGKKMKEFRLLIALLSLILVACLSGVEGQYTQYPASSGYPATLNPPTIQTAQAGQTTDVSQYAQYYTMGAASNTHITAPQQFAIADMTPATVYFGNEQQPVAFSQYQSNPAYAGVNSLWIAGSASWAQYVTVPQGSSVPLLASSPRGGEGYISEIDPNGKMTNYPFYFYPNSLLQFYADTPGRHVLSFVLAGQPSNQVTIDVVHQAPSYYTQPSYYSGYPYYWDNYPWYWGDYYWGDYPWYWYGNYYPDYDHRDDRDHHDGKDHDGKDHDGKDGYPHNDGKDGYPHNDGKNNFFGSSASSGGGNPIIGGLGGIDGVSSGPQHISTGGSSGPQHISTGGSSGPQHISTGGSGGSQQFGNGRGHGRGMAEIFSRNGDNPH
jgi:hypothetical protein